jgi:hypothetical protein
MFQYEKENYVGRKIQLFPGDSVSKWGVIEDVDDLGFTIRITKVGRADYKHAYDECKVYFINHSSKIVFKFMD